MSVTVVYRSATDMNRAEYWYEEGPKMQERAIKAEAEVERLRLMVKSITGGLDEAVETVNFLEAENARLLKVVEAARLMVKQREYVMDEDIHKETLRQALAELDKEEGEICNTHLRKPCFSE